MSLKFSQELKLFSFPENATDLERGLRWNDPPIKMVGNFLAGMRMKRGKNS
jgi:hypothetical protein